VINALIDSYNYGLKAGQTIHSRSSFLLSQIFQIIKVRSLLFPDKTQEANIRKLSINMMSSPKTNIAMYGIQLAKQLCNHSSKEDSVLMTYMKLMTHSKQVEVRKYAIKMLDAPYTPITLFFLGKRLRDKD
jgi:hypothetical protein